MEINDTNKLPLLTNNHKLNKISHFFSWLDTKIKIIDHGGEIIKSLAYHELVRYRGPF
jgi:hypothetical protein